MLRIKMQKHDEQIYKQIVDAAEAGIWLTDLNGIISYANSKISKIFGMSQDSFIGRDAQELVHSQFEKINETKFEINSEAKNALGKICIVNSQKEKFWLQYSISPVKDRSKKLTAFAVKFIDITAYQLAQAELIQSENYFRSICEAVPQMVWTSKPNGQVNYFNKNWYDFTGIPVNLIESQSWKNVVHQEDGNKFITQWSQSMVTSKNFEVECRFQRNSDKQYRWHLVRALPLKDKCGKILKWFGTCTDIHDQKLLTYQLEEQVVQRTQDLRTANLALLQAAKMKALGEMAGGIAHEINNPLSVIIGYSNLLQDLVSQSPVDVPKVTLFAGKIDATASRIGKIVEGLRDFSREDKKTPAETVLVKTILESTLELCRDKFLQAGVQLQVVDESDAEIKLTCRPIQISQVLLNLINNGFYAAEKLSLKWVQVKITSNSGKIQFAVTDSGVGLTTDARLNLFKPFFTTKPMGQGTGLGLSISKNIIESHQGELTLDTNAKNTRFIFTLPLDPQEISISKIRAA